MRCPMCKTVELKPIQGGKKEQCPKCGYLAFIVSRGTGKRRSGGFV